MNNLGKELDHMLQSKLSSARYKHTKGVATTSAKMAKLFGIDQEAAYLAGIYHDAMREESEDTLLAMAKRYLIEIGKMEKEYPVLLHGPVAAKSLENEYGVTDKNILEAITWHTTGTANMCDLSKIVYLADMIEPTRVYPGVEGLRELAYNDLEKAFYACVKHSILHVINQNKKMHENTVACWNDFIELGGPIGIKGKS
ncbi:bis(5'-nucleosyl)-tetraphosphatase (symmetrical) YqeK [Clostridia bacterium]|nr:bis(5'-nucleosyl)-tetraphosphatase (symmetrical) YqeK [Clostridia bacterium]